MKTILLVLIFAAQAMPATAAAVGCVYDLNGPVTMQKPGETDWLPATKGAAITEGDKLRTGARAWCEILFKDGTYIKMEADSETGAEELKTGAAGRSFSFSFLKGKALWMAAKLKWKTASRFTVRTPSAVCAVRGTDFTLVVSTSGATSIGLFEGKVAVSSGTAGQDLNAGGEAFVSGGTIAIQGRLSALMKAEERRYARVKGRVEKLRGRLAERDNFIDDYVARQQKTVADFEKRRQEKLGKR
ncbi:MAG: FecR family protein [Elusimicrobiales bacterium]|nr:FecR family protein [Elusimicrobiales bacterium]